MEDTSVYTDIIFSSEPFKGDFKVQSIASVRYEAKVYLVIGGNHSVLSSPLTETFHIYRLNFIDGVRDVMLLHTFDMQQTHAMKKQKVTTITQYKASEMVALTLSNGYIVVVNITKMVIASVKRFHKG